MLSTLRYILYFSLYFYSAYTISGNFVTEMTQDGYEYIKGHLLVKTKKEHVLQKEEELIGVTSITYYDLVDGLKLYKFDSDKTTQEAKAIFEANKYVDYVEFDYIQHKYSNDSRFNEQWALENTGQSSGLVDADINAEKMWAIEKGSSNVVIGIIDTGVDYTHPDLVENMGKNSLEIPNNQKDDDNNGYVDDVYGINAINSSGNPMDDNIHGTHVAGIIGARGNNNVGISGVAQKVSIMACKFLNAAGSGGTSDAIKCLEYFASLKNTMNIVATNNSWGGGPSSKAMKDAIKVHETKGILFIAAAGNDSKNNDTTPSYPASYDVDNIISVASTDRKDLISSFSNYGKKTVHVAAPGSKILSTVLNHGYGELSGTSMAAPQVSGLTAVIASKYPSYGYKEIKNLILTSGQSTTAAQNTTISGKRIRGADDNGVGALTCNNQTLKVKKSPLNSSYNIPNNESLFLSALHINCEKSGGDLTVYNKDNISIVLQDLGTNGDEKANDGVYSLLWKPTKAGVYELDFGNDKVNVTVYGGEVVGKGYKPYSTEYNYEFINGKRLQARDETMHHVISDFPIPFLGNEVGFSKLYVSSNGTISFTDMDIGPNNLTLPQSNFNTIIAPFWDDLKFTLSSADIYVQTLGVSPNRKLIVEWWKVQHFNTSGLGAFQVIFYENSSDIRFNYLDTNFGNVSYNYGQSATVGIQAASDNATSYSYKTPSVQSLTSILFKVE